MRNVLLLILFFSFSLSYAQIEVLDENVSVELLPTEDEVKVDVDIHNTTNQTLQFFWEIDRALTPPEWEFKVCDTNLCYVWGVEACPCSKENVFPGLDTATMQVYINPNGVEGTGTVNVKILETCGRDSLYASFPVDFVVNNSVSTQFQTIQDKVVLYPNPSGNYFKIKNDENVSDVVVHNIIGKKMFARSHRRGMSHDISQLNNGIYLVRLLDKSNNIVKVLRLNKE